MNIDEWMVSDPQRHGPVKSYAEVPRHEARPGEDLFRTRCAACHNIGGGDGVGPDFAGVTERRKRGWLARWLADPEKLMAEKDPQAVALYAKHRQVAMPSLKVREKQVADLL